MASSIKYGGWLLSLLLLAACVYLYMEMVESRALGVAAEQESKARLERADARAATAEANAASTAAELEGIRQELAELKGSMPGTTPPSETPDTGPAEASPPEPEATPADEADAGDSAERGDRIVTAQMEIMANMAYQDLFGELGLDPDTQTQMRDVIAGHLVKMQKATLAALQSKNRSAKAVHAEQETLKGELRAAVESVLAPEQMAAWDEYDPVAEQIMYERLVDGQLNMMAAGLSNENRVLASQVMAEELVREFDVMNESEELFTMDNYNNAQARALNASLERLNGTLEADQYGQVEGFVNQALTMFEAMAEQKSGE